MSEYTIPPYLPPGWQTGSMRLKAEGGGNGKWNKRIQDIGKELTRDIMEQLNISKDEARALVEEHLVGRKRNATGRPVYAASPDAQRLLDDADSPNLPPGWQTGGMLSKAEGSHIRTWNKRIQDIGKELTRDIMEQLNISEEEARALVEHNLVGEKQPAKGRVTYAASPDAQRILDETHAVKVRRKSAASINGDDGKSR